MQVDQHTDWTTVYTVEFEGVYMLDRTPRNNGNVQFRYNNDSEDTLSPGVRFLPVGTTIQHKGPAATLFGTRLGNEF